MIEHLKPMIYNTVIEANRKMSPSDVEKAVAKTASVDRKTVRLAIKDLVSLGELGYTYVYGTSFLEKSFDRPVRVSKRIVIKPPEKVYKPQSGEVVVNIAPGAAFGNGAHPSTYLALRALDNTLADDRHLNSDKVLKGLDVGTGTGVLAIALARLGIEEVVGLDIDPCAVSEAASNVSLNGLAEQVMITNTPLEDLATDFSIIVANITCPTIRRLSSLLSERVERDGLLVLSGFKESASKDLGELYAEYGFKLIRQETEREWMCMTFCK